MQRKPTPHADITLSAFLIVVCCAVLWESRKIPPGSFEPLGSGPIPQAVAALIILLCLVIMLQAVAQLRRGPARDAAAAEELVLRPLDAAAVFALTVAYVAILAFGLVSFALATVVFLFITIALLTRFKPMLLPIALLVGVVMGFGCQYLFTEVFVVDLPSGY